MDVFVYGTLTEPERVGRVVDSFVYVGEAVLEGLHPVQGRHPTLAPGGRTPGRLLRTRDVGALDAYEGVDDGPYVRVSVPLEGADGADGDGADEAAVYVGDPERLDVHVADSDGPLWPGDGGFARRVRSTIADESVRVRTTGGRE